MHANKAKRKRSNFQIFELDLIAVWTDFQICGLIPCTCVGLINIIQNYERSMENIRNNKFNNVAIYYYEIKAE